MAAAGLARVLLVRCILALIAVPALLGAAWWLYSRSMTISMWGPYDGVPEPLPVARYSTPWLLSAAGAALVAGLLLVSAVGDLVKYRRVRRFAARQSVAEHPPAAQGD